MDYLDSSAITKLLIAETESEALRRHLLSSGRPVTSALARVEVTRAALRRNVSVDRVQIESVFRQFDEIALDERVLLRAGIVEPSSLRSLDAIHIAAALAYPRDIDSVITYDARMQRAAALAGLAVVAPR